MIQLREYIVKEVKAMRKWFHWLGEAVRKGGSRYTDAVTVDYEFEKDRIRKDVWVKARLMRPPRAMLKREEWLAVRCQDKRIILYPKSRVRSLDLLPQASNPGEPKHYA